MKKLMSTRYGAAAFNFGALGLRVTFGSLMFIEHGLTKLNKFGELENTFADPLHIGHKFSLLLVLFSEVVCSLLLILGLLSRLAAFVLFVEMVIIIFMIHRGQPVSTYEVAVAHVAAYFMLLLTGPGRISVDAMSGK
ncbi:MAG TPA: DoxX family protein [Puia sp.]|nr:DoxX family protein [Puia sp.]